MASFGIVQLRISGGNNILSLLPFHQIYFTCASQHNPLKIWPPPQITSFNQPIIPAFQLCISVSFNRPGIHTVNISTVPPGAKFSSSALMPYALLCSEDLLNRMRALTVIEIRLNLHSRRKGFKSNVWKFVRTCTTEERGLSPMYAIHPVEDCSPEFVSEVHLEEETNIESLPSDILGYHLLGSFS